MLLINALFNQPITNYNKNYFNLRMLNEHEQKNSRSYSS